MSIFLSLLENDERYAEWNTTIIIPSCFCKSATGCVVCINRAVVNTVVSHIDIPRLSPVRTVCCVPYDTITPVSRHVLSVSRALYMELHFHVLVIVRRDYHFRIKCLSFANVFILYKIRFYCIAPVPILIGLRLPPIFDNLENLYFQGWSYYTTIYNMNTLYVNCMALLCNLIERGEFNYVIITQPFFA